MIGVQFGEYMWVGICGIVLSCYVKQLPCFYFIWHTSLVINALPFWTTINSKLIFTTIWYLIRLVFFFLELFDTTSLESATMNNCKIEYKIGCDSRIFQMDKTLFIISKWYQIIVKWFAPPIGVLFGEYMWVGT